MTLKEVHLAFADGKRVLHLRYGEWRKELSVDDYAALLPAAFSPELWRLAPEPVPPVRWQPCDVPPVCWLRSDTSRHDALVIRVEEDGVCTRDAFHTFHELADPRWKHSTDRISWRPCSKEASE